MFSTELSKEVRVTLLELKYALEQTVVSTEYTIAMSEAEAILSKKLLVDFVVKDLGFELTYIPLLNASEAGTLIETVNDATDVNDFHYEYSTNGLGYLVAAINYALNIASYSYRISDESQTISSKTPLVILNGIELRTPWDNFDCNAKVLR